MKNKKKMSCCKQFCSGVNSVIRRCTQQWTAQLGISLESETGKFTTKLKVCML